MNKLTTSREEVCGATIASNKLISTVLLLATLVFGGGAAACTSPAMKTTESGFVFTVIGGSDKVEAMKDPGGKETAFTLDLLAPYFLICEDDQFYKITGPASRNDRAGRKGQGRLRSEGSGLSHLRSSSAHEDGLGDYAAIPLAVMNGELLDRLRAVGIKYNS